MSARQVFERDGFWSMMSTLGFGTTAMEPEQFWGQLDRVEVAIPILQAMVVDQRLLELVTKQLLSAAVEDDPALVAMMQIGQVPPGILNATLRVVAKAYGLPLTDDPSPAELVVSNAAADNRYKRAQIELFAHAALIPYAIADGEVANANLLFEISVGLAYEVFALRLLRDGDFRPVSPHQTAMKIIREQAPYHLLASGSFLSAGGDA